jgi:hypothetical protein
MEETKLVYPPHSCYDNCAVIECNNVIDKCKCRICGKEWETACNFDEDYD